MLADKIGRKPVFITGAVASSLVMFPYLARLPRVTGWVSSPTVCSCTVRSTPWRMACGPPSTREMFPTCVRVTGLALGTQIGFAISGGVAPAVATSLAGADLHNAVLPAVFTVAMCVLVALGALTAREGYKKSLAELDA